MSKDPKAPASIDAMMQDKYDQAVKDYMEGLLTTEEFTLIESEFENWSKRRGQLLNG